MLDEWRVGDVANLGSEARATIDSVLGYYGSKTAHWLSELAHREAPWRDARADLRPGERGDNEIGSGVWTRGEAEVSRSATLVGPLVIDHGAAVDDNQLTFLEDDDLPAPRRRRGRRPNKPQSDPT